ncbi:MAG: MoaD/ThiS family protein [Candidatus Thermoplasmatota archaeon]|nr:MoaD/ThiS family protein [Candidatus Thermoplasmatota archaeon]
MKVKITRVPQETTTVVDFEKGETIQNLLKRLHLRSDAVIVIRGGHPIPEDDTLQDEQELQILQVASGG